MESDLEALRVAFETEKKKKSKCDADLKAVLSEKEKLKAQ